jgi:1-acyl-sn-glycerol-3-phosphate acyltransferase
MGTTDFPPAEELRTLVEFLMLPGSWMVMLDMAMTAFSAGLFIVPLYTLLQVRGDPSVRSRVIAANNIINAIFMVGAGMFGAGMIYFGFTVLDIFKVAAIFNLIAALYILSIIPHFLLRLIGWVLIHSIYRIKKHDLHHIPEQGPALLVCNHVSFVDPVILLALAPRPARFVMYYTFYELPIAHRLFKWLRSIPIGPKRERPNLLKEAMDTISQSLEQGQLVCVFPEGGITKNGEIQNFQPGVEDILKRNPVPVIPLAIRGMWGSWFSRHKGSAMQGLPAAFMKRISVISGPPIAPEDANRISLYEKVMALRGEEK